MYRPGTYARRYGATAPAALGRYRRRTGTMRRRRYGHRRRYTGRRRLHGAFPVRKMTSSLVKPPQLDSDVEVIKMVNNYQTNEVLINAGIDPHLGYGAYFATDIADLTSANVLGIPWTGTAQHPTGWDSQSQKYSHWQVRGCRMTLDIQHSADTFPAVPVDWLMVAFNADQAIDFESAAAGTYTFDTLKSQKYASKVHTTMNGNNSIPVVRGQTSFSFFASPHALEGRPDYYGISSSFGTGTVAPLAIPRVYLVYNHMLPLTGTQRVIFTLKMEYSVVWWGRRILQAFDFVEQVNRSDIPSLGQCALGSEEAAFDSVPYFTVEDSKEEKLPDPPPQPIVPPRPLPNPPPTPKPLSMRPVPLERKSTSLK